MKLAANIIDIWAFQRRPTGVNFLLLHTSAEKARKYFNGGRFWQIPSGQVQKDEPVTSAISRILETFNLVPQKIWAAEHAYLIYNRRFEEMQAISVYAAEVTGDNISLNEAEHSEAAWLPFEICLERVNYRGLKDGLRSVQEYITGLDHPASELCLYDITR